MIKSSSLFRFNCDRLWKLWYSVIIVFIQMMLICLGISNYVSYKSQSNDPKFGNQWSKTPLNFLLFAIILCCSLLVLFIYSCIFKVGNIANDGVELGIDPHSITSALNDISLNKGVGLFILRLKTHFLPYSCLLHIIMALLLALPLPFLQAEQIKNEAMSPDYLWITDIGYILNPQSPKNPKKNEILCHHRNCYYPSKLSPISPEFINLLLSLLILIVRLPSPFWYTNKAFSIIFSLFTFVTVFCVFIEYECLIIYIRSVHNQESVITNVNYNSRLSVSMILILFFIKSLFMLFMLLIIFEYGYTQYLSNMRKYRQYFSSDVSDSVSQQSLNNQQIRWYEVAPRLLGVIILVFITIIKIPFLLMFIEFSSKLEEAPSLLLITVAMLVLYFIICVFLWFGLCIKNKWQFHINIQMNPIPNIGPGKLAGSPEPVYGCFYNAPSVSSQTSMSKPILRASNDGSEVNSYRLQSGNYVMMQAGSHVMPIREAMEYSYGDSEASYGSHTKSCDSNDLRYKQYAFPIQNMENAQYATLASLQSGVMLTSKTLSDSSSNDTAPKSQSRRGSNRVTFREPHDTINLNYRFLPEAKNGYIFPGNSSTTEVPDILSMNNNNRDKNSPLSTKSNSPHGFDPDLEMSTDMRQPDDPDGKGRDPRLCSQV